jgi:RimJ/RimL family protein N-acetyltransferase
VIVTDERVARFVGERVDSIIVPPFTTMGIEHAGDVVAGVVFNHFTGPDVHATIAGHGWTKGFLADVGHYVFDQLKCIRITVVTEQPHIVRIAERLGGEVEGLLRSHFGQGRDGFLVGILKEDWKF